MTGSLIQLPARRAHWCKQEWRTPRRFWMMPCICTLAVCEPMTCLCSPTIMLLSTQWFFRSPARRVLANVFLLALLFNCRCTPKQVPPPVRPPNFDASRAFENLKQLCDFGPRNHGSESKSRAEKWIQERLNEAGAEV